MSAKEKGGKKCEHRGKKMGVGGGRKFTKKGTKGLKAKRGSKGGTVSYGLSK